MPLKYVVHGFDNVYAITSSTADGKFKLEISSTATARQNIGQSKKRGIFFISNASSWAQLNKIVSDQYEAIIRQPLPTQFVAAINKAKNLNDSKAKIESIAKTLQHLVTYSGDWRTVRGQFFPVGHSALVKNGRGDCKDYATSMTTILRNLGFTAYVAISFRRNPMYAQKLIRDMSATANLAYFNHAIVWAKDSAGKTWWIDPTNPMVIADVLSQDLLGNFALVLDGKSNSIQQLPEKNGEMEKLTVVQSITARADNSVEVSSLMTLNAPVYNTLAMIDRQYGPESMKRVLSALINPMSKANLDYKEATTKESVQYSINLNATDWIVTQGKSKTIFVSHPALLSFMHKAENPEWDFGEEGLIEYTTTLKDQVAVDPIDHECIGRSKWLDFDRVVTVRGKDTEIQDRVVTKKRFVSVDEFKSDDFTSIASGAQDCARRGSILTSQDPSLKTVEQTYLDKLKGPPVERMTDADAQALADSNNLALRSYSLRKRYKYYLNKTSKQQSDLPAYAKLGLIIEQMGYLSNSDYITAYTLDGMKAVDRGIALAKGKFNSKLWAAKTQLSSNLGDDFEANRGLKLLLEKDPKSFDTNFMGYYLSARQKNYAAAETWLKYATSVAVTRSEKTLSRRRLALMYSAQKRTSEAIALFDEILKDPSASAWDWHNAATIYVGLKNNPDKVIELEKKALSIAEFGAAKSTLAYALIAKANTMKEKGIKIVNGVAEDKPIEDLLLESLKWDPDNIQGLAAMADLYSRRHFFTDSPRDYEKSRTYIAKAITLDPNNEYVRQVTKMVDERKVPVKLNPGRLPSANGKDLSIK